MRVAKGGGGKYASTTARGMEELLASRGVRDGGGTASSGVYVVRAVAGCDAAVLKTDTTAVRMQADEKGEMEGKEGKGGDAAGAEQRWQTAVEGHTKACQRMRDEGKRRCHRSNAPG